MYVYLRLVASGQDLACVVIGRFSVTGDRTSRTFTYEASVPMGRPIHGGWLVGYTEPFTQ